MSQTINENAGFTPVTKVEITKGENAYMSGKIVDSEECNTCGKMMTPDQRKEGPESQPNNVAGTMESDTNSF